MEKTPASARRLRRRFERLAARLGRTDWILLGTLHTRRVTVAAKAGRRPKVYGPYYQWTFKRDGRTVTVNLSRAQLPFVRDALRRQRTVERLLEDMRALSRQFLDATTPGVPKRKPRR